MTACVQKEKLKAKTSPKLPAMSARMSGVPVPLAPPWHHPAQHARGQQGRGPDGQRAAETAEEIDLPRGIAQRQKLEKPREERPERISRRMRHTEMLGGHDELAGVEEADVRLRGVKIDRPADQGGRQCDQPVGPDEHRGAFFCRFFGYERHGLVWPDSKHVCRVRGKRRLRHEQSVQSRPELLLAPHPELVGRPHPARPAVAGHEFKDQRAPTGKI